MLGRRKAGTLSVVLARRVPLSFVVAGIASAVLLAWAFGCGPGVQAIYEGNVRFEHCYRLDVDPHISPTHREACWREWTQLYTYGQTQDRVDYAERRIHALASGDYRRPLLNLQKSKERPEIAPPEAPIPTSLHAPPPAVLKAQGADGGPDAAPARPKGPKPPDNGCVQGCHHKWDSCRGPCEKADAGARSAAAASKARGRAKAAEIRARAKARAAEKKCRACVENYRRCMERCFK